MVKSWSILLWLWRGAACGGKTAAKNSPTWTFLVALWAAAVWCHSGINHLFAIRLRPDGEEKTTILPKNCPFVKYCPWRFRFGCFHAVRWCNGKITPAAGLIALVRFVSAIPLRCSTSILVIQIWWNIFLLEGINSRWLPRCRFSVHIFISWLRFCRWQSLSWWCP